MEEKLVKVLIDEYKERGIDLYALLDDKYFMDLKLPDKINMIKKYASHISSGTSKVLTKKDIRSLIIDAGFAGLTTGALTAMGLSHANSFFGKPMTPYGAVLGAVALGTAASAAGTFFNTRKILRNRQAILERLGDVERDPSDENALRVLVGRSHQVHAPGGNVFTKSHTSDTLGHNIKELPRTVNRLIPAFVESKTMLHNLEHNPRYATGHDLDSADEATRNSMDHYKNTLHHSLDEIKRRIFNQ